MKFLKKLLIGFFVFSLLLTLFFSVGAYFIDDYAASKTETKEVKQTTTKAKAAPKVKAPPIKPKPHPSPNLNPNLKRLPPKQNHQVHQGFMFPKEALHSLPPKVVGINYHKL